MSTLYTKTLSSTIYDGPIDDIHVFWSNSAQKRLHEGGQHVPQATRKAVSEHFAVLVTTALKNSSAKILASPHDFTVNSKNKKTASDEFHVTVHTSGGSRMGNHDVHIYFKGAGKEAGPERFDNLSFAGQTVFTTTRSLNLELSSPSFVSGGTWETPEALLDF